MAETLISPAGTPMRVGDAAQAAELRAKGWNPASSAQEAALIRAEEYGSPLDVAGAAAAGVARGATLGLSDVALSELGAGETLRAYRELHPGTSMLGEIGGSLLGAAKLKGPGLLLKGLRALSAPARGVVRVGEAAAALGERIGPVAGAALRGVTEGALLGAQQAVTEDALGERALTGQSLLASVGYGAATGGILGTAMAGSGKLVRGGMEKLGSALRRPTEEGVDKVAMQLYGEAADGVGGAIAKVHRRASEIVGVGGPTEFIDTLATKEGRAITFQADERIAANRELAKKHIGTAMTEMLDRGDEMKGAAKYRAIASTVNPATADIALQETRALVRDMHADISALSKAKNVSNPKMLRAVADRIEEAEGKLLKTKNVAKGMMIADDLKRDVDKMGLSKFRDMADESLSGPQRTTKNKLVEHRQALMSHLEREDLFGDAAKLQRGVNERWSALFEHIENNPKLSGLFKKARGATPFSKKRVFDEEAFNRMLANPSSEEGQALIKAATELADLGSNFVGEVNRHAPGGIGLRAYGESLAQGKEALGKITEAANFKRQYSELAAGSAEGGIVAGLAGAAGFSLGPVAAPLGIIAKGVLNPAWAYKAIYGIESASERLGARMQGMSARAVTRGALRIGERANIGYTAWDRRERKKALDSAEAARTANPQTVGRDVAARLGSLNMHAPGAVGIAVATAEHAAENLAAHAPERMLRTTALMPIHIEPPDDELNAWDARRAATNRPEVVARELDAGDIPHPDAIDALREIYPEVYREHIVAPMLEEVQRQLNRGGAIDAETATLINYVTDVPVNPLDAPEIVDVIAEAFAAQPKPPPTPPRGQGGASRYSAAHKTAMTRVLEEEA